MTVLGEAFIEVKADLKPFVRDLDRELTIIVDTFEKRLKTSLTEGLKDIDKLGEDTGDKLGDSVSRRIRRKLGDKRKPPWVTISAAFAAALDDGISALPTEVKAALVFGVIAALPILSGALAGAVSAAIGLGLAGIGTFIAFQYDEVRERGEALVNTLRLMFIDIASPFVPAVLDAIDVIENRFQGWVPMLAKIFSQAAKYVQPLTDGILDLLEGILKGIEGGLGDIDGFVVELASALKVLGAAIGQTIKILANTGEAGRQAFRDLIFFAAQLLLTLAQMIALFAEIYKWARALSDIFSPLWAIFAEGADEAAAAGGVLVTRNQQIQQSTQGVIKLTDEEVKRLKELSKALKDASDATYDVISSQVDFQRSLDGIQESLSENGKTLDITGEKGRQNVESFIKALRDAQKETDSQITLGKLNAQQAADFYELQIQQVRKLATAAGITGAQFDFLFGDIIKVAQLKLDAAAMGLTNTTDELSDSVNKARELYDQLLRIRSFRLPAQGTRGFSELAEGGIVTTPTHALIGEAGPEVVIPLTKPSRAAQLMQRSGLGQMLGAAATLVQVFIGNEQLEGRMVRIVESNNAALGNSLAFGARGL